MGTEKGAAESSVEVSEDETAMARVSDATVAPNIGRVLAGRYEILRFLGEGGMGVVYEAQHLTIGKRVAVKIMSKVAHLEGEANARFLREARAASLVDSEHIAQVYDVGEDLHAGLYMILELLRGEDLATRIGRKERLDPGEAIEIALQACDGLIAAHAAGIVHRDLKPANIFLCRRDDGAVRVKLIDLGIAKLTEVADDEPAPAKITRTHGAVGTLEYMSPEQAQGLDSVGPSTDLYSLGAVLYEMIVGVVPFPQLGTTAQTLVKVVTQDAPRLSASADVDPRLDALVAELLAKDPSARPASAVVLRARLSEMAPDMRASSGRLAATSIAVLGSNTPAEGLPSHAQHERAARTLGRYRLFARLGRGGM
ncbi:MAG: serine/threonine protein kinase, partial [Myxococcaceae bacterium]|nr:serine/threonine protein kinase [Myxococcaceae bacterium]